MFRKISPADVLPGVALSQGFPRLCPEALWAALCRAGISPPEVRQIPVLLVQVAFSVLCLRHGNS